MFLFFSPSFSFAERENGATVLSVSRSVIVSLPFDRSQALPLLRLASYLPSALLRSFLLRELYTRLSAGGKAVSNTLRILPAIERSRRII